MCTSYWDEFDGGVGVAASFIEYAKQKVDELNADFVETEADQPRDFACSTLSVTFHQGMVVFEKQANTPTKYLLCQDGALSLKGMQYDTGWTD
jgi:hypothetical protein